MCISMIDPATSWFEMVELPVTDDLSHTGIHIVRKLYLTMEVSLNSTSSPYVNHME